MDYIVDLKLHLTELGSLRLARFLQSDLNLCFSHGNFVRDKKFGLSLFARRVLQISSVGE